MQILRAEDHRRMPWANGGGITTEIARHPAGADMASFGWRVSMAPVTGSGAFSPLPGVARVLAVIEGPALDLEIEGLAPVRLTQASAPFAFDGGAPCMGRVPDGPILDLNVMCRALWSAKVARAGLRTICAGEEGAEVLVLLLAPAELADGTRLARLDALRLRNGETLPAVAVDAPVIHVELLQAEHPRVTTH